jgi:protein-S-isoprenylcysteine O-methyltransferase Ste14
MIALRTLIFSIFVPGMVAGGIPFWYLNETHQLALLAPSDFPWAMGIIPFAAGIALYLWCAGEFTFRGKGTPAPIDSPSTLVVKGPYRRTRNPMYCAVLSTILGEALYFRSPMLAIYAILLFALFHLFIISYEEPTLQQRFGAAYTRYRQSVPRWVLF